MLNYIKEKRAAYHDKIMKNIKDYSYRNKRYHIDFAIAIGLCNIDIDINEFKNNKRETDTVIPLENNLCCIILDCAPADSALKATSNLQDGFHDKHSDKELYTSVVSSSNFESDKKMVNSLFDILEYSIANNMEGLITDLHHIEQSS